jgi:O-antigen/teichoic acid export membrane protein
MSGRQQQYLGAVALAGVLAVILNLVLIPWLSSIGAAMALLGTDLGVAVFTYWSARRIIVVSLGRAITRPLAAAALMGAGCWLLAERGGPVWSVIVAGAAVYGITLLLLGGVDASDLALLRRVLARGAILEEAARDQARADQ